MPYTTAHKFLVSQEVETKLSAGGSMRPGVIKRAILEPVYEVEFPGIASGSVLRTESEIQSRTMTEDQAWEKVAVLCGARDSLKQRVWLTDQFDTETRHQAYQILGKAHVKITDEVKARVRGLIQVADAIEY